MTIDADHGWREVQFGETYIRALTQAGFVLPQGYGKGFPVLREPTLIALRVLREKFIEHVSDGSECVLARPSQLVPAWQYSEEVREFGGFDNCFEVQLDGRQFVLRPDAALSNLRTLVARHALGDKRPVVAVFQGFRKVDGATAPLFRDRFIFPFVQFNRLVPMVRLDDALNRLWRQLGDFFEALALPVRIVDFGSWKSYARKLVVVVAHLPGGKPTIVAMCYVVGETYRQQAGIPDDVAALDVGITEKVLATLAMKHRDQTGIRLPSVVAPTQVVVSHEARALGGEPLVRQLDGLRVVDAANQRSRTVLAWSRRGAVLQLYRGRAGLRAFGRTRGWYNVGNAVAIRAELEAEDLCLLRAASEDDWRNAFPRFAQQAESASTATGRVVYISRSLSEQAADIDITEEWYGPRVFY
ncbi:UNVERIFIED_ORG: hypothetical protein J2791_002984 [Burkholderia contaminans]|nr:hypothetical protein [Burkholderia contaminans]